MSTTKEAPLFGSEVQYGHGIKFKNPHRVRTLKEKTAELKTRLKSFGWTKTKTGWTHPMVIGHLTLRQAATRANLLNKKLQHQYRAGEIWE